MALKKQTTVAIFILLFSLTPFLASAAGLVPCGGDAPETPCTVQDVFYLIARVTNWLILMAGVYAVYQIVNSGFWLVASAGEEEAITKRKNGLSNAIVGFFIVMGAFMFMNTAVNFLLMSKCTVDFRNPLNYITVSNPRDLSRCTNPNNKFLPAPK